MQRLHTNELITEKYSSVISFIQDKLKAGNPVELKQENLQYVYHTAASLLLVLVRLSCITRLERKSSNLTGNKRAGGFLYRKTDSLQYLTSTDLVNIERIRVDENLQNQIKQVLLNRSQGRDSSSVLQSRGRRAFTQPGKIHRNKRVYDEHTKVVLIPKEQEKIVSLVDVQAAIMNEATVFFKGGNYEKAIELREISLKLDQDKLETYRLISNLLG